ncbi:MAG: SGNH/GDSL hydrolase family protein [Actinomycetota bacterium]
MGWRSSRARGAVVGVALTVGAAGALATGSAASTAAGEDSGAAMLLPWGSDGYRYQEVAHGGSPGFEQPGFDDSSFAVGDAPFGSGGACPLSDTVDTPWGLETDLLVRRWVEVPAGTPDLYVSVAADNAAQVFWNGVEVVAHDQEGCAMRGFRLAIPPGAVEPGVANLLAVRGSDRGVESYLDVAVTLGAPVDYVALGDSYSSGEGNPPFIWPTHTDGNHCHRSEAAYPQHLADHASELIESFTFVACSGAVIDNFWGGQENEGPQVDAISSETDLVTLTAGGNDMKFKKILTKCAFGFGKQLAPNCFEEFGLQKEFEKNLRVLGPRLRTLYDEIRRLAHEDARVYVVGYPQIFPVWRTAECPWRLRGFTQGEIYRIRRSTHRVNERIRDTARAARVGFVDVEDAFKGHELCKDEPYVNQIIARHELVYSFHPNEKGHRALFGIVRDHVGF